MCQVIDTQVLRANVAVDHKLYQARLAISWLTKQKLKVLAVELNSAVPELTIEEPNAELELHKKAYQLRDSEGITYLLDFMSTNAKIVKIARIKWHQPVIKPITESRGLH